MTTRLSAWLLIVGFLGHAPGLKFFFRRSLPSAARSENLVAIVATLIVLGAAALLGCGWRWLGIVWLTGHLAWGARVVWIQVTEEEAHRLYQQSSSGHGAETNLTGDQTVHE